jgi:competence protein ComEA
MNMTKSRFLAGAAALMMAASPVLAQTAQPTTPTAPARPAPASPAPAAPAPARPATAQPAAPAAPARPATAQPAAPAAAPAAARPAAAAPAAAPAAVGKVVNINTASADELDTLKGIGPARAKKIMEERAKARFRNFDDLVQRNVLPSNVEADLRGKISF